MSAPQQFPLALALDQHATFDNFWPGPDGQLLAALQDIARQPQAGDAARARWHYVSGAAASGVSHLLQATVASAQSAGFDAIYLSLVELAQLPSEDCFAGLEHSALLCIDEIEQLEQCPQLQQPLLFLLERSKAAGGNSVVFGGKPAVAQLALSLADLHSRLGSATQYRIQSRDDEQLGAILRFRADRIGLAMPDEVARFVLSRCSRSLRDLLQLLDELDRLAMAQQRRLTIPFVKDCLGI